MKTALQIVRKEIAELWSSPGDDPNYTQIFEVLERNLTLEKQQIIEAYHDGCEFGFNKFGQDAENYYETTFNQPLKGI